MVNDDVASVNARREYMGNVTVLVNQTSLSRVCTVFKKTRGFFFRLGRIFQFLYTCKSSRDLIIYNFSD